MADSAAAILPVGAGYGTYKPHTGRLSLTFARRRCWYWILLCLLNDGHLVDTESIYGLLDQAIGRI